MSSKTIFLISAFVLFSLISISSISAYSYLPGYDLYPVYNYYGYDDKYNNIPIVLGPYPRSYLWHMDAENGKNTDYLIDDFNHYDDFIGYKDLDLIYPNGMVEVIRNENARETDTTNSLDIPEGMKTFGNHVYGYIPGPNGSCIMYRKHYSHEHPWEVEEYNYNYAYGYGYGYYTPFLAYRAQPVYKPSCQSISACEYRYCAACNK